MNWVLFGSALLSSTLFPGGSEALLLYRLHEGADLFAPVATVTGGNVLGVLPAGGGEFLAADNRGETRALRRACELHLIM